MLNRIVGVLVVLAIVVLVFPSFFNPYARFSGQAEQVKMPPFPTQEAQNETIKALVNKEEEILARQVKNIKILAKKNHPTQVKDNKTTKLNLKSIAWVIQVGSYKNKVEALRLANQLRAKGYNAFIHQANAAFGAEVQVYIGPEIKKETAVVLAERLAKETRFSGVVKSYRLVNA